NATNVTRQNRSRVLRLLRDYGARIEIVYLEVSPDRLQYQNRDRPGAVPDTVIVSFPPRTGPLQLPRERGIGDGEEATFRRRHLEAVA
ncbi:MAG: AAA family ATPase, partial [Pseudomonadota bacterium]